MRIKNCAKAALFYSVPVTFPAADENTKKNQQALLVKGKNTINHTLVENGSVIPILNVRFDVNDRIVIVDGLFKGMEGFISDVNRSNRRINFEVTLMDGKRILSLSYQELQKKEEK